MYIVDEYDKEYIVDEYDKELIILYTADYFIHADDSRISKSIGGETETKLLQNDLANAISWFQSNNMQLHEDKFDLIVHKANNSSVLGFSPLL